MAVRGFCPGVLLVALAARMAWAADPAPNVVMLYADDVINFPPYTWIDGDRVVAAPDVTLREPPGRPKEGAWGGRG